MRIHAERDNDHTETIQTEKRNQKRRQIPEILRIIDLLLLQE